MPIKFKCTDEGMWDVFSIHPNQGDGLRAVSRFIHSHAKWEPPEGVTVEILAEYFHNKGCDADVNMTRWKNLERCLKVDYINFMRGVVGQLGIEVPVRIEKTRIFTTGQGYTAAALRKIADELDAGA